MDEVTIGVINESPLTTAKFRKLFAAVLFQIERDYNTSTWVKLGLAPKATLVQGDVGSGWTLTIVPHGNGQGGEGWHEEGADGSIKGFVNYGACHATGIAPSLILSHEAIEMLVRGVLNNPDALREIVDPATGDTWRAEPCDPVIDNAYEVFGEQVSDFCEAAWYGIADGLAFAWYSCRQTIGAAHELGPKGYAEVKRAGTESWTQVSA